MWNLQEETAFCLKQLQTLNIPYGHIVSIVPQFKKCNWWGRCTRMSEKEYQIKIHGRLLSGDIPIGVLRQTIIHEILHTCPECFNHGPKWKMYGRIVSEAYGYTITRFVTEEEKQCLDKSQCISVPELMPKDKLLILTIGSHVRHRQFGDGLVINVKKMGSDALLEIAFQDGTSRNLMQKLASTKMQLLSDESVL